MNLYNKYRPRKFDDIYQTGSVSILKSQIITNNTFTTYLFSGPSGTGKTTMARVFSMALMCPNTKDGNPCGKCDCCKTIINSSNRDVIEINCAVSGRVGETRDLIAEQMLLTPVNGNYRIFILDEVHMLTTSSQNALLKIMEEPPKTVKFILCTTDPNKILNTIQTRCQHYLFKKVCNKDIISVLLQICKHENINYEERAINIIAANSEGSVRSAITLLDAISSIGVNENNVINYLNKAPREAAIQLLKYIQKKDTINVYKLISALDANGQDLISLIEECCSILLHDMLSIIIGNENDCNEDIVELSSNFTGNQIIDISNLMLSIISKSKNNIPPDMLVMSGIFSLIYKK